MIPDTVPFDEAAFKCDFLSGEIYSVGDQNYKTGALYQAIKSELDLDKSFCSLPSGEFSMWLGNVWDFNIDPAGDWTEYRTGTQLDFQLQTIKTPSNPEVTASYSYNYPALTTTCSRRKFVSPTNSDNLDQESAMASLFVLSARNKRNRRQFP